MTYKSSVEGDLDSQEPHRASLALRGVALQRGLGLAISGLIDVVLQRIFEAPRHPVSLTESRTLREGDDAIEVTVAARPGTPRSAAFVFTAVKRGQAMLDAEYVRRTPVFAQAVTGSLVPRIPDFTNDEINGVPSVRFEITY